MYIHDCIPGKSDYSPTSSMYLLCSTLYISKSNAIPVILFNCHISLHILTLYTLLLLIIFTLYVRVCFVAIFVWLLFISFLYIIIFPLITSQECR